MPKRSTDKIQSRGIGLKQSEWAELEKIADDLGMTPHALAAYGIRHFMKEWREGKIKAQAKKTLTLPDL